MDESEMSGNAKAFVACFVTLAAVVVLVVAGIVVNGQMNLSKDHNLRTAAMQHGYVCNRTTLEGTYDLSWLCEKP